MPDTDFLSPEAAAAALQLVGEAHHALEKELPERDRQVWYAQELHRQGFRVVPAEGGEPPDSERIAPLLKNAADAHVESGSEKPWPEFYSHYLAGLGWRMTKG